MLTLPSPVMLLRSLVVAALAEVILLRLLMRIGGVLPWTATLGDVYRALQLLGTAAANLATLLALGLIGWLALGRLGQCGWTARAAGLALGVAALLQIGLLLLPATAPAIAVVVLTSLALAGLLGHLAARREQQARLIDVVPLAVMLAAVYAAVGQPARALGVDLAGATLSYTLAEVLALVMAAAAPALLRVGWRPWAAVVALGAGLLVVVARLMAPWSTGLAAIWTFGFSLFLPASLYGGAVALLVYALLARGDQAGNGARAAGLLLLVVAGLKLDHGYFALLALTGLSLIGGAPALLGTDHPHGAPVVRTIPPATRRAGAAARPVMMEEGR